MFDDAEFDRWREAADDALRAARDNAAAGWSNWACMIAEQAAQLAAKAVLHAVGRGDRARGHDLVKLFDVAVELTSFEFTADRRAAAVRLARHYQPTRYPDALPGGTPRSYYTRDDAEEALVDAELLVRGVDATAAALREASGR